MIGLAVRTLTLAGAGLLAIAAVPTGSGSLLAQGISATASPTEGSAQRRAILDAIRPGVEAQIGPNVEFVVRRLRVVRGWALMIADPQRRGGRPIDGHRYFPHFDEMGGLMVTAVLRFQRGRWRVVEQAIGATDVWFCDMGPPGLTPSCRL
jgi:hypothetical protein